MFCLGYSRSFDVRFRKQLSVASHHGRGPGGWVNCEVCSTPLTNHIAPHTKLRVLPPRTLHLADNPWPPSDAVNTAARLVMSLKPDCKTAHKTTQINSDGRASRMTVRPYTTSSADETVALLATVIWACVSVQ